MAETRDIIGTSPAVAELLQSIEDAARTDTKVLITGESGVGKEVAARLIHAASRRSRGPMVIINCAAIADSLLESELFGHERGSFTGAYRDRVGLLEHAQGGTVFLDEIGEMSLRMQGLLLRFLETGEIQRVGSVRIGARVDVRVIAATNRLLLDHVVAKTFREDLYYRLNVFQIVVPPLRERAGDVSLLFDYFQRSYARKHDVEVGPLSPEARTCLEAYTWPGNIRELKNIVERIVVRLRGRPVTVQDLPGEILTNSTAVRTRETAPAAPTRADVMFAQMVDERRSFWAVVYPAFMSRDLTRDDLRAIVGRGLQRTSGNYKLLVRLFNMQPTDYKRFLNFLRKHQCHMPFQQFRTTPRGDEGSGGFGADEDASAPEADTPGRLSKSA
ncbi:MAG TPA: sigma-54 dependent transcriptional regulator [Vicinamibacterales bacterium]|jgi:transcriptional regulator with PAS, ATPase and Fis domain|nr:sigma-54 dependent transcriptional regulator [Vicinamibacterales bacterium]